MAEEHVGQPLIQPTNGANLAEMPAIHAGDVGLLEKSVEDTHMRVHGRVVRMPADKGTNLTYTLHTYKIVGRWARYHA